MAPGFSTLREEDDGYDSADDLDFSGLLPFVPNISEHLEIANSHAPQIYENNTKYD